MSLFPPEDIEMGNGYTSRFSLRTVRLILAGLLLALLTITSGIHVTGDAAVFSVPAAIAADHTGGSTGGG